MPGREAVLWGRPIPPKDDAPRRSVLHCLRMLAPFHEAVPKDGHLESDMAEGERQFYAFIKGLYGEMYSDPAFFLIPKEEPFKGDIQFYAAYLYELGIRAKSVEKGVLALSTAAWQEARGAMGRLGLKGDNGPRYERLKGLGIAEWLEQKKKSGAIRQVGFSYHGNSDMFCQLADAYDWDFCQIQYNYMDENTQAGRRGLQYAASRGLPVIIMEPLRGGKLVNHLPKEAEMLFDTYPVKHTPADWAFRWLWNQPEVTCVLSGMNSREMVEENVKTASEAFVGELGPGEQEMLEKVVQAINAKMKVGCTGCGYCMPCPRNVDIPGTFAAYNRRFSEGKSVALMEYFMCTAMRKTSSAASNCIKCGKCEKHCPQHIEIRQELKNARRQLEGPLYKIGRKAVELLKLY